MGIKKVIKALSDEADVIFNRQTKDKVYSSSRNFDNLEQAENAYRESEQRLFNVDRWSKLPGVTSTFELFDDKGQRKKSGPPRVGDFLRIILPGPLPENWVQVTDIKKEQNKAEFTVSPCPDPRNWDDKTEHFFIDEATSTFKVEKRGIELAAFEIGRNEGINNDQQEAGHREFINTLIAEGGWAGFQKIQWKKLTDYLVHKIELED